MTSISTRQASGLEAENTVVTENDCTGHAETNLIRLASKKYPAEKYFSRVKIITMATAVFKLLKCIQNVTASFLLYFNTKKTIKIYLIFNLLHQQFVLFP